MDSTRLTAERVGIEQIARAFYLTLMLCLLCAVGAAESTGEIDEQAPKPTYSLPAIELLTHSVAGLVDWTSVNKNSATSSQAGVETLVATTAQPKRKIRPELPSRSKKKENKGKTLRSKINTGVNEDTEPTSSTATDTTSDKENDPDEVKETSSADFSKKENPSSRVGEQSPETTGATPSGTGLETQSSDRENLSLLNNQQGKANVQDILSTLGMGNAQVIPENEGLKKSTEGNPFGSPVATTFGERRDVKIPTLGGEYVATSRAGYGKIAGGNFRNLRSGGNAELDENDLENEAKPTESAQEIEKSIGPLAEDPFKDKSVNAYTNARDAAIKYPDELAHYAQSHPSVIANAKSLIGLHRKTDATDQGEKFENIISKIELEIQKKHAAQPYLAGQVDNPAKEAQPDAMSLQSGATSSNVITTFPSQVQRPEALPPNPNSLTH